MSSRVRPYLQLKKNFLDLFRGQARWLKDTTARESIFEKPYLEGEYRQMHLAPSLPSWGSWRAGGVLGSYWGVRKRVANYIFPLAQVWANAHSPVDCGEPFTVTAWIPGSTIVTEERRSYTFTAISSEEGVSFLREKPSKYLASTSFTFISADDFAGVVTIKVSASTEQPYLRRFSAYYTIPAFYTFLGIDGSGISPPSLFGATTQTLLTDVGGPSLPTLFGEERSSEVLSDEVEVTINCDTCVEDPDLEWDYTTSDETIGPNDSGVDAILLAVVGNNGPFSWSVSGTGFSLGSAVTSGLTNSLSSSGACGLATITVTGCDGVVTTGYVRCTAGQWTAEIDNPAFSSCIGDAFCSVKCSLVQGKYWYRDGLGCTATASDKENCGKYCLEGQCSSNPCSCVDNWGNPSHCYRHAWFKFRYWECV